MARDRPERLGNIGLSNEPVSNQGVDHLVIQSTDLALPRLAPAHGTKSVARGDGVTDPPARGFVFALDDGRPMRPETVATYIGRYLHDLSIPASAHQLRHWFGTTVYARSKDLRVTQELLGHASPQTTAIYVGWSPTDAASVVRGLCVG